MFVKVVDGTVDCYLLMVVERIVEARFTNNKAGILHSVNISLM